jgi:hypothetical protein
MSTQKLTATKTMEASHVGQISMSWFTKQADLFENGRLGLMAILITLQSCVGSIACMYILQNGAGEVPLAVCAALTMGCNAILIAQANAKLCVAALYVSLIINALLIAWNV